MKPILETNANTSTSTGKFTQDKKLHNLATQRLHSDPSYKTYLKACKVK